MQEKEKKELSLQQVLTRLTALCAAGERCCYDMTTKMKQWNVDEDLQQQALDYLIAQHFVDDERYARAFVHDKLAYQKWGPRKIAHALSQKRIADEVQQRVLGEIDDEDFVGVLQPLLATKRRSTRAASAYELRAKLFRFAAGRGFTVEQIKACLGDDADFE